MPRSLILIADANFHIRCFLKREIIAKGFEVISAKSHTDILERLETGRKPELVVLDPNIPFIGGVSLLHRIRSKAPQIPVIIYTAYPEDADSPLFARADAVVEKAPDPALLIRRIHELLGRDGAISGEAGARPKVKSGPGEPIEK